MPIIGGRTASVRGLGFQGAGAPAQVTGLTATDVGTARAYNNGAINLSWSAPANNGAPITGYFIERSTDNSTWSTVVSDTATTSTTYQNTSLSSAQIYYYRVSAINAVGTGTASSSANATATTVPQAPTIGTATAGSPGTGQATLTYTAGATGGKAVSTYTATSSPGSITGTGASPITISGLTQGTAYTFTVTATNANGTSSASSASNSVTPLAIPSPFQVISSQTYTPNYYPFKFNARLIGAGGGDGGGGDQARTNNFPVNEVTYVGRNGGGGGGATNIGPITINSGTLTISCGAGGTAGTGATSYTPGVSAGTAANGNTGGTTVLTVNQNGTSYNAVGGGGGLGNNQAVSAITIRGGGTGGPGGGNGGNACYGSGYFSGWNSYPPSGQTNNGWGTLGNATSGNTGTNGGSGGGGNSYGYGRCSGTPTTPSYTVGNITRSSANGLQGCGSDQPSGGTGYGGWVYIAPTA